MGDLVRFPQERCRWPAPSDQHEPPATIMILPVVRIERKPISPRSTPAGRSPVVPAVIPAADGA